jgi:hypothetical protein
MRHFFYLFYSQHYKYRFTVKLGHAYVECRDVHTKISFEFFSYFQMYFLNKWSICTLYQMCIPLRGVLDLGCICTLYLKYNLNIF